MREIIVNSNCYHGYSLSAALDGLKAAGFSKVELTATKGWTEHVFPTMSFYELVAFERKLEKLGISAPALSGHTNLMDPERLEDFKANIELAGFFGCRFIVSSIGEAHLKDRAENTDEVVKEHLVSLLPLLEKHGLVLVLETHGQHGTARRIKQITDLVNNARVRICYDTANAIYYGDVKGTEDLEAAVSDVAYLHIKDKKGERTEWNFPALGEGYVDFPSLLGVLDNHSNPSPLSIEIEFTPEGSSCEREVTDALVRSRLYLESLGYTV